MDQRYRKPSQNRTHDSGPVPKFDALFFRRGEPRYFAFDLLWLDGEDLRSLPLVAREEKLRAIIPAQPAPVLYVDHVCGLGTSPFGATYENDLEGIIAKRANSAYEQPEHAPNWLKIRNRDYSQLRGRHELFSTLASRVRTSSD